ncbi:General secretion pathway protein E, partial [hydrothermal vent metagenome]
MKKKEKFGQLLIKYDVITLEQLETALCEQKKGEELFGETLLRLGFVEEEMIYYPILAEQLGINFINLKKNEISAEAISKISAQYAYYYKIIPVEYKDDTLTIALTDPLDIHVLDGINLIIQCKVKTVLACERDILESIRKYYGVGAETIEQMMGTADLTPQQAIEVEDIEEEGSEASISKFVNQILLEAYKDRATDVHVEPYEKELVIRYRIDGTLYDAKVPPNIKYFMESISSRIKIMANLSIAEKRLPQDGRFKVRLKDIDLDLRVSFMPTPFGESIVIRILNATKLYTLAEIGLSVQDQQLMDHLIKKPHGIIFLTGPTGSGKTTTLYSSLSRINSIDRKIITIEDPIEYQIRGITQTQINPSIGFGFKEGLRSILRHDPDVIMVGEVRDLETAEIAIQVALTGHLVFSTLHTNDAASGVTRLLDMGLDAYLISSSVQCFIAQRLIRLLCKECKAPAEVTPEMAQEFGVKVKDVANVQIYHPKGCEKCNHTGFYGRQAMYEFLVIDDAVRDMIMSRATA